VPPTGSGNRIVARNAGALDRNRRGARDTRRTAQDAAIRELQHSSFLRRFPMAAKVSLSYTGR
jgi:hypothetical protein